MFWGLTQALNLIEEYENTKGKRIPNELNIIIIGSSDCRHVLATLAKQYQYDEVKINFYVVESCVELIARQLLLLNVSLQPQQAFGLEQKTKIFMELYGNTLLRPSVAKYLSSTAMELLKMITNYEYLHQMMPFVTLECKYKERDYFENILKFWYGKEEFDILEYWNRRLRKLLGVRYDSRMGAFDWDLHMRLRNIGANQICNQEYRNFRTKGLAFSWIEFEVSKPNRSLVCAVMPNGNSFVHHGYLGEMQTGPFVAFGLNCEDKEFLKSTHGQNSYRATDVIERNLKQIFYEIENKTTYNHVSKGLQLGTLVIKEDNLVIDTSGIDLVPGTVKKCINLKNANIQFLSINSLNTVKFKTKHQNKFDVVYFSSTFVKYLDKNLVVNLSKPEAMLIIENELFVLSQRKDELQEFARRVHEELQGLNMEKQPFDPEKDEYLKFILKSNNDTM